MVRETTDRIIIPGPKRFLGARGPMAVFKIPGCQPVCVNPWHAAIWPQIEVPVQSAEDFSRRLETAIVELHNPASPEAAQPSASVPAGNLICWCERVHAILSMRTSECVHESCFQSLAGDQQLEFLAGFELNLEQPLQAGARTYQVSRVHARALAVFDAGLPTQRGLLEIRLVLSQSLRVIVRDNGTSLVCEAILNGNSGPEREFIAPFSAPIDRGREDLEVYRRFEKALEEAHDDPVHARTTLETAALEIAPDYLGLKGLVSEMLASLPDTEKFRAEVLAIRTRLWDGPIIGALIRDKLEERVAWELDSSRTSNLGLPLAQRADLARLALPLRELEATDRFEGLIPLPKEFRLPYRLVPSAQ